MGLEEEFNNSYTIDWYGCCIWNGKNVVLENANKRKWKNQKRNRYGFMQNGLSAHRYSYMYYNNNWETTPQDYVCHRCDIKGCVNPKHLFLGTDKDNRKDYELKKVAGLFRNKRGPKGSGNLVQERIDFSLIYFPEKSLFSNIYGDMKWSKLEVYYNNNLIGKKKIIISENSNKEDIKNNLLIKINGK